MTQRMLEVPGYRLHKRLGKGGMAEVYLATQLSLDREVAVKVLLRPEDAAFTERFILEGHIVASLRHPAIITIYDIGQVTDGRHYLAMEYIGGGDLAQHRGLVFSPSRALDIIRQLAGGLAVVHDGGLVHRDVKPANILFRDDGSVVLTDFGVAKAIELDNELTHFGIAVGSPAYSSPEQAQCQTLDARSDIYSLGVILAEMLIGTNPFRAGSYPQTVLNHVQMPAPQLPPALAPYQMLLDRMLAKQPSERFGSCRELLEAIDTLTEPDMDQTRIAPAVVIASRPTRRSRRRGLKRWGAIGAAMLATVTLGVGGYQWFQYTRINDFLTRAEVRLANGQLIAPALDNADYYYRRALRLDADNPKALDGLKRVLNARIAESLVLAETGNSIGAIQVAGTANPAQLPFFVAACDYTLIGEEFFAASAILSGDPDQLGSLKGQDIGKLVAGGLMILAQLEADDLLERVERVVKLGGFVASVPDFTDQPKVVNGASDLMAEVFGDKGKHARSAVGVPVLPLNAAVEVDAVLALSGA